MMLLIVKTVNMTTYLIFEDVSDEDSDDFDVSSTSCDESYCDYPLVLFCFSSHALCMRRTSFSRLSFSFFSLIESFMYKLAERYPNVIQCRSLFNVLFLSYSVDETKVRNKQQQHLCGDTLLARIVHQEKHIVTHRGCMSPFDQRGASTLMTSVTLRDFGLLLCEEEEQFDHTDCTLTPTTKGTICFLFHSST